MTSHTIRLNELARGSSVFSRAVLVALATSVLAFTATQARAEEPADVSATPSLSVTYVDLNLATEEGTLALYKRIVSAARQVCPADTGPNLRLVSQARRCVDDAVARAVNDIQSPKLAELQAARTRRVDRG
jgi:UrcA family protein